MRTRISLDSWPGFAGVLPRWDTESQKLDSHAGQEEIYHHFFNNASNIWKSVLYLG